ncbi:metallopeptidase MepB [Akanthomyces lecanii RCEF 1005]|uniref:Metallopeptidase MepB n=1 Tax=Akanthomyces lecanii RCEF 1005 TaxID=1081108 RepID=A0A168JZV8_CORDF|nr:metallopeptidase MepB [Akanthomyces lecanii RCEF 1005]
MSAMNQQPDLTLHECPQPLPYIWARDEIVPQMKRIISKLQTVKENVVQNVSIEAATFDTVMRPILEVENATINEDGGTIWMQQYGSSDLATQDAVAEARRLIIEHESSWEASEELFKLMMAARKRGDDLDSESKLLLDKALLQSRIAGCGSLDQNTKNELIKETLELEKLCMEMQGNLAHESSGAWFTEEELAGVPVADLERFKNHNKNKSDESKRGDKIFVAFANSGHRSVITHSTNPETRRRMYLENEKAFAPNIPLMQEIVEKRQRRAQILGFKTHAHLKMESRLLDSPEQVQELINTLKTGLKDRVTQELGVLQERRHQDLFSSHGSLDEKFPPWDRLYYQRLVQGEHNYDAEAFSEYFPVETVPAAMLSVFESYLGLKFVEIRKDTIEKNKIWDETVTVFAVWDVRRPQEREFVGYLYFDLLWRENKFRGAHNVTLEFGYEKADGSRKYPSTRLMSAFPTADDTGCALLKHKLGHAIHNLVSKTKYFRFHGTNLPSDLVEMPSLMLENWCWMPEVLTSLSTHYALVRPEYCAKWRAKNPDAASLPPRQIPSEMVEARLKSRFANESTWLLGQLAISQYDLAIHSADTAEAAKALDFQQLWYDIHSEMLGFDYSECRVEGADMVSFHHLVRGYDVAYYSYPCCLTFATEMFENIFSQDPSSKEAWERYRTGVLEYGGGHPDLLELLRDLLGHEPTAHPLVQMLSSAEL